MSNISLRLAQELQCKPAQVNAAIALLDEGATVPFIARYRKEVTGGLDDGQLRLLNERLRYLRELDDRRAAIIAAIDEQGQLTAALRAQFAGVDNKQALEDLYLPYKQKRRTKAQIAREAGLAVLAESLLKNPQQDPEKLAANFICEGFADTKAVLEGAKAILLESWGEDAALIGQLRSHLQSSGLVTSKVVKGQESAGAKFSDYFDFSEKWAAMPSHRVLAVLRGANEKILSIGIQLPEEIENGARSKIWSTAEAKIARHVGISANHSEGWLGDAVRAAWRSKLGVSLENELLSSARERAELDAIKVFSRNLKDLLLAAPAGPRCTLGLDPGLRTGVKVAVVDATGKLLATDTIYPHEPRRDWDKSLHTLKMLCDKHGVELIAIGNGTASRETEQLATELIAMIENKKPTKVVVSEAGASVYSASELAAKEFPELDVSIRGAVSIARRLQDPLAELVKIDPNSIGVGQYQHDVNQHDLARMLDAVVEDCVNAVGVDVNTASAALLSRVSGLSPVLACNVVAYRDEYGAFQNRKALLKVPRLGGKTFELAAGFLRIMNGDNPLDASAVHPEAYPVVEKLLQTLGKDLRSTMGNRAALQAVQPEVLVDAQFGLPTVKDILAELEKPGRDPRPEFKTATFAAGIEKISDLQIGMVLEGVVSNVTNFGAFVDVGVHQDGLVHISMLANTFVKDPHSVVKAGQVVKVKVLEVDVPRKRIALTMRLNDETPIKAAAPKSQAVRHATQQKPSEPSAMANAFASLKLKK